MTRESSISDCCARWLARVPFDALALGAPCSTNRCIVLSRAWRGRAGAETIGERRSGGGDAVSQSLPRFCNRVPKTGGLTRRAPQDADRLRYGPGFYNLALLELFGLLDLRLWPPAAGQDWLPERLRMTEGESLHSPLV